MKKYNKVWVVGDSHTGAFIGMHLFNALRLGPETIYMNTLDVFDKKDGRFDTYFVPRGEITRDALWLISLGEIDCRTSIWSQINEKGRDEDEVLKTLVDDFFISLQNSQHQDFGFVSVPPAIKCYSSEYDISLFNNGKYAVRGDDYDRARYVTKLNQLIKQKCYEKDWPYIDIHQFFSDEDGFLIKEYSDGNVHIIFKNKANIVWNYIRSIGFLNIDEDK